MVERLGRRQTAASVAAKILDIREVRGIESAVARSLPTMRAVALPNS
jgi:hypothetical protein